MGNAAFGQALDRFFAWFYERNPVDATFTGVHDWDDRLPDVSPEANAVAETTMIALRDDIAAFDPKSLTEAERHDWQLALGALDLRLWENRSHHFHLGNPSYYTGEAIFSILSLFHRDSEPVAVRAASAIARMRAIPAFLAQARAHVTAAPAAWTARAIKESKSGVAYFARGIQILAAERQFLSEELLSAAAVAEAGFREHLLWLEEVLSQQTNREYAAGQEAFESYLSAGHALAPEQGAAWVEAYARAGIEKAQRELESFAESLAPGVSWREQMAKLADLHPTVETYYDTYTSTWEEAKAAAIAADLVTWPDYPISYIPFPESDREAASGLYYLFYRCPAPLGQPETHKYRVTPIEQTMPADEQERKLRATNNAVIKLNHVVHHGGLGHHVQNWNAFRAESRFGRLAGVDGASRLAFFSSGSLVEGWACYTAELMGEVGYLSPLETISEKQGRVRMAARAICDVGIHTGTMTLEDAAAFYEDEAGMTADAAMGEAVKNSMFPGAAMMYLIGTDAIYDLRARITERDGDAFSLRAFHDQFLSYGAIPVALIAKAMA